MSLGLNLYSGVEAVGPHLNSTGFQIYQIIFRHAQSLVEHEPPDGSVFVMVKNLSTSNNAGTAANFGVVEVYADVQIWKV